MMKVPGVMDFVCFHLYACLVHFISEGGGVRENATVFYPIYYAEDNMFRPLWAIFRSQKCV